MAAGYLSTHTARLNAVRDRHAAAFLGAFGVKLRQFWHPVAGFDVLALDAWLGTPNGQGHSMISWAAVKFGQAAADLLDTICVDEITVLDDME